MNLAELFGFIPRRLWLREPIFRLPFDSSLSADELRIAEQRAYDYGPVPWEDA